MYFIDYMDKVVSPLKTYQGFEDINYMVQNTPVKQVPISKESLQESYRMAKMQDSIITLNHHDSLGLKNHEPINGCIVKVAKNKWEANPVSENGKKKKAETYYNKYKRVMQKFLDPYCAAPVDVTRIHDSFIIKPRSDVVKTDDYRNQSFTGIPADELNWTKKPGSIKLIQPLDYKLTFNKHYTVTIPNEQHYTVTIPLEEPMEPSIIKEKEALEASIEHWESNRILAEDNLGKSVNIPVNGDYCPLCKLYAAAGCDGCTIYRRTGCVQCQNTPWSEATKVNTGSVTEQNISAINDMVLFLKSLRADIRNREEEATRIAAEKARKEAEEKAAEEKKRVEEKRLQAVAAAEKATLEAVRERFNNDVSPYSVREVARRVDEYAPDTARMLYSLADAWEIVCTKAYLNG